MQKNTLVGIAVLVIIAGALGWYALSRPASPLSPSNMPAQGPYVEKTATYDITANYPTSTPLTDNANTAALSAIHSFIETTIAQFKKDITGFPTSSAARPSLTMAYLIGSSPRTISYIYTYYEDTGGAHGNTFFKTFVFDKTTGAQLALKDLFVPGSSYNVTLSGISRTKLIADLGTQENTQMINSGTTPEDKNFENFFFDNHNLDILFTPYQVAPYAAGPQTVQIPTSELTSILKPAYQ